MAYKYEHFIPQNTAPNGAKKIGVYDVNGDKVCDIPLGRLTRPNTEKLYSVGLLSDIHLWKAASSWNGNTKFDNALSYIENCGCTMCVVAGDLTQTGFYLRTDESDASTTYFDETQFAKYKEICDKHSIPVYALCGNHESTYDMAITSNLELLETYTGKRELFYTVTQGNDLFILCGQPSYNDVMGSDALQWLGETLEANKGRRCFVFVHSYIEEDSGDPGDHRENSVFDNYFWGAANRTAFMDLMSRYKNAILFHGHSHMKFECQEQDKDANYTEKNGFKSVHIPSLGRPRNIDATATNPTPYADAEAQGYIVDVYDDCIVLNGWDFVRGIPTPHGTLTLKT